MAVGRQLLGSFLKDARIKGITPKGEIYDHLISKGVSREFVAGLTKIRIRGTR
jgi:hypothetical protein